MKIIDPMRLERRWNTQFGMDYTVPVEILALCKTHPYVEDVSWGNDVCPSFGWSHTASDTTVALWVDHPDRYKRENGPDAARFTLTVEIGNHRARQMLIPGEFENTGVIWSSEADVWPLGYRNGSVSKAVEELTSAVEVASRILIGADPADLW